MTKQSAYEEMCKREKGVDGKYTFSFDEVADIVERHLGIPKEEALKKLSAIAKQQKGV